MLLVGSLCFALLVQGGSRPVARDIRLPLRATAIRAQQPPVLDGRDDDPAWRRAAPISDFLEFEPNEGKAPRFATEAKVAYDQRNFYVFVRAYDDEPEKILKTLARRDVRPPTDQLKIIIDSYYDRRTGYEFAVSPGGVKRDYLIYDDGFEDGAWDAVWDVATAVDSLGWTAEFRIPLSQLRYANRDAHTFGFGVWRDIERYKERVSWPLYRRQQAGLSSQLGELAGIQGLSSPRRLEVAPYVVTRNVTLPDGPDDFRHEQQLTGGADFKYGVTSNLTLDGTINPDFGQIEADPSVLNLGAFETFFQERRPFFLEGVGLFRFEVNCYAVNDCGRENLFYSRRIGRAPQLSFYGDESSASATTILGAAKLTGRLHNGLSVGLLDAVTQRETGLDGRTMEPAANYAVLRATKDFRDGETGIGAIGTMVNRNLDEWTRDFMRSSAMVAGLDVRHRFLNRRYQISARLIGSHVTGSEAAIAATQRSNVHSYQRPDGPLDFDPTRTSLGGDFEQIKFGKVGGSMLRFETSYQRTSPGFEINDLGFLNRADKQNQATWAQLAFNNPALFYRRLFWNVNQWHDWTAAGLLLDRGFNTNVHTELKNSWWLHKGLTLGGIGNVVCDRCARGGPALRTDGIYSGWGGIEGDGRGAVTPGFWFSYWGSDEGRSHGFSLDPSLRLRISSRLNVSASVGISKNTDDRQWYGNFVDDVTSQTHYTFAHLEQRTTSLTGRFDFTATPTLTLQVYASPFISKGTYSNLRELNQPRAENYEDRFQPYTAIADPGGFNVKEFRSNVVARWEYRPGSALFVVWQQGRSHSDPIEGPGSFSDNLRTLFDSHPNNTFLIKLSYWFDR
ncbi:MAG TPA: DUF5916 domain-containing protein [Gemmatimonadales bacterium]|nr:DUF5916 domain-containing protein [Gemmatimonadales bacterium]